MYDDFSSTSDFELVVNYARELGVLLWELPSKRQMFVTMDGHQQIRYETLDRGPFTTTADAVLNRDFIKRRMAGGG